MIGCPLFHSEQQNLAGEREKSGPADLSELCSSSISLAQLNEFEDTLKQAGQTGDRSAAQAFDQLNSIFASPTALFADSRSTTPISSRSSSPVSAHSFGSISNEKEFQSPASAGISRDRMPAAVAFVPIGSDRESVRSAPPTPSIQVWRKALLSSHPAVLQPPGVANSTGPGAAAQLVPVTNQLATIHFQASLLNLPVSVHVDDANLPYYEWYLLHHA